MPKVTIEVNGELCEREVEPRRLLVEFLREDLGKTGTHVGCDTTQCGCCTVILNGDAIKSCTMLAVQADGGVVETIEGVGSPDQLHPVQRGFRACHALQCGFCTPGMIMNSLTLLRKNPDPTEAQIRHALDGNICRCTGYQGIVEAIQFGAKVMAGADPQALEAAARDAH
jgi:aerobic carbon-monoxide dehydrogenase small subunit